MFSGNPNQPIRAMFKFGRLERFRRGEIIFGMDPSPAGVYLIESGFVKLYSITPQGDENVLVILGKGEIFPFVWAYLSFPTELYGETICETKLWRVSRERYTVFAQSNAAGGYALARQMALQFQIFNCRLENLEFKHSHERVAYRILFLANRFGKQQGSDILIDAPITQELLAQTINLTRESVSRELNKLRRIGAIDQRGRRIIIRDVDLLSGQLGSLGSLKYISKWQS